MIQDDAAVRSVPPSPAARLDESVSTALQQSPLLKMLSAGWATPEDLQVIGPVLLRAYGVSGTAPLLEALSASLLHEDAEPSFLKYFLLRRAEWLRQEVPATAAAGIDRAVAAQAIAALRHAMRKLGLIEGEAEPLPAPSVVSSMTQVEAALSLHLRFLADLYAELRYQRLRPTFDRIQSRLSLERKEEPAMALWPGVGEIMFAEADDKRSIEFTVERYPCTAEVLDPRVVRIPPGKSNNRHKHAHETLFYFISGTGEILVGEQWVPVKPGDAVFSPRWSIHQTRNTGSGELTLLAITDYYLTCRVYVGKYDKI